MLSVTEFADKIKKKYPEYKGMNDADLVQKVVDKYPVYRDQVNLGGSSQQQTLVQKPNNDDMVSVLKNGINTIGDWAIGSVNPSYAMSKNIKNEILKQSPEYQGASTGQKAKMEIETNPGAVDVAEFVADSTVKPLLKTGAMMGAAQTANMKGATAAANYKELGFSSPKEAAEAAMVEEQNMPWLGNVNLYQKDDQGKISLEKTAKAGVGTAVEGGVAAMNLLNPTNKVINSGVRGGIQSSAREMQNPDSTLESIATAGVVGGALSAAAQGLLNKFTKHINGENTVDDVVKEMKKMNARPDAIERVKSLTPDEWGTQHEFLKLAKANVDDPDNVLTPMEKLSNDVTDDMKTLYSRMQEVGKKIGGVKQDIREGVKQKIDINSIKQSFLKDLDDDLRVKLKPINEGEGLDFGNSKLKRLTGDQQALNNAWEEIKNAKTLDDLMVARDTLRNEISFGRANQQISTSEAVIKKLDKYITDKVHATRPDLAEFDDVFSTLRRATEAFQQKTGGKTAYTVEDAMDGTNTFNILRRSLGAGNNENKKLLEKLETLGQKYELPTISNVMKLRRLAQTAEDIVGTDQLVRQTSLGGRIAAAGRTIQSIKGFRPLDAMEGLASLVQKNQDKVSNLIKLFNKPLTPKVSQQILKNPIVSDMLEMLKVAIPQNIAKSANKSSED